MYCIFCSRYLFSDGFSDYDLEFDFEAEILVGK